MKVLIIGHACSPRQGSEPSFTWNWACQLSRYHQVWVLAHPHDRSAVERAVDNQSNQKLKFHWLDVPQILDPWRSGRKGHDRGLWLHYLIWLRLAYRKAIKLHKQIGFDIVHHVSYGSVSAPPPVRKVRVPFIWGPLGGAQVTPVPFRHYFGRVWQRELVRNVRVRLLRFSPSLRWAAKASFVTLATNRETASLLKQIGARDVRLCLDSGLPQNFVVETGLPKPQHETLRLLWAGRMQPRKALPLALEALAQARDVNVRMLIAGDGEMRKAWERYAKDLNLGRQVEFLGAVPWSAMPGLYRSADAFLFTSLRDSFGTQVLEAMGHGLPILTLDHQGVATFVPREAGIKIPVTTPTETVLGIVDGIRWLVRNPEPRLRMGEVGRAFAKTQTWEHRADWMSKLYLEALEGRISPDLGSSASYGAHAVDKCIEKSMRSWT